MINNAKVKAKEFLSEYRLTEVGLADLERIIASQGYTIIWFNHILNEEPVASLIEALDLGDMVAKSKGFTYADAENRLVFLHEGLSDKEKLLVLAHEEGHIYCDHLSAAPVIGKDVVHEHEANEFTHYILNRGLAGKVTAFFRARKKLCCILAAVLAVCVAGLLIFRAVRTENGYYGEYYLTASGKKYHKEACIFVKDKTNTHRMTVEEYESGDYEPCGICLPLADSDGKNGD